MRVLLFTLEYPPFYGGVANYYGNLVKYWPKSNSIFVLNNNKKSLINTKMPFLRWLPAFYYLYKEVRLRKINHVIVGHVLPLGLVACIFSRVFKIKYTIVLHGLDFSLAVASKRKSTLTKLILKSANKIVCANSYTASLVSVFLKKEKQISVVNPGIVGKIRMPNKSDAGKIFKKNNKLNGKYVLLSVGRLVKRKGFDNVIKVLPEVLKKAPNLIYVIIGSGEEEANLHKLVKENELEEVVMILNDINNEDKQLWYNSCDCFIMVSREIEGDYEGFGIVYLEAGLAGKPCIAGDSGGVRDAVCNNLNGLLVESSNLGAIQNSILKLFENEKLRIQLAKQGRSAALSKFDWGVQANIFYSIISR